MDCKSEESYITVSQTLPSNDVLVPDPDYRAAFVPDVCCPDVVEYDLRPSKPRLSCEGRYTYCV